MRNIKIVLSFITGAITGALAVIMVAIRKGSATGGRKLINKNAGPAHPENKSFQDFIDHIKTVKFDIEERASDLENKARVKMRSLKADFKTVFGNPLP
jgi:hypothetical protein